MVCKAKTFNAAQGGYEAPQCKVYRIKTEGQLMNVSGGGNIDSASEEDYDEI